MIPCLNPLKTGIDWPRVSNRRALLTAALTVFGVQAAPFSVSYAAAEVSMGAPLLAPDETPLLLPEISASESLDLVVRYEFQCSASSVTNNRVIPTELDLLDRGRVLRTTRLYLVEGLTELKSRLGVLGGATEARIRTYATQECRLGRFVPSVEPSPELNRASLSGFGRAQLSKAQLVEKHAPFLGLRSDQRDDFLTDIPYVLAYHWIPREKGTTLRYTIYFSDEDSLKTSRETDGQMARYGRRLDIEWLYEVDLDETGRATARRYQGSIFGGMGHQTKTFKGRFLPGTEHPILYTATANNTFNDSPNGTQSSRLRGVMLKPEVELEFPKAREWVLFERPWLFSLSDRETATEGKLSAWAHDYLYVLVEGKLTRGAFSIEVQQENGEKTLSGNGRSNVDRLGQDSWGRQSFTGVPLGEEALTKLDLGELHGEVRFVSSGSSPTQLQIESAVRGVKPIRFFRLSPRPGNYQVQELTDRFTCSGAHLQTVCAF